MGISNVRKELEAIKLSAEAGDMAQVVQQVAHALHSLDEHRLLTTTEAAELLGIRSVNTLKLLIRRLRVPYERHGNRMMIAMEEIERLQQAQIVQGLRASDRAHDALDTSTPREPLTPEQLNALEAERPGSTPWQRTQKGAARA